MLQEFNSMNIVENLRELNRLKQEYEKTLTRLHDLNSESYFKLQQKGQLAEEKSLALVSTQKVSIFSKFASIFHVGKYYQTNQQIKSKDEKLSLVEKECLELESQIETLKTSLELLKKAIESRKMPACLREENGSLVVTSNINLDNLPDIKDPSVIAPSQKVLVHCTNFFPVNNIILSSYSGGKIASTIQEYRGVKKETSALIHRHEVHCTINNRVENTGAGEGNWDNPTYIIIDRYDVHEDEMESTSPSDAWTKGTDIHLSDRSVILVRLQDKDKLPIPPEEINNYNIIYYDGSPTTCLRNFLKLNNYDMFYTDPQDAGHAHSTRMLHERGLESRNLAINFVKDNSHFSKEPPIFSSDEIAQIVDVGAINSPNILFSQHQHLLTADLDIPEDKKQHFFNVANFVIGCGLKKTEDGRYTFKNDEDILNIIEEIRNNQTPITDIIDIELISEIFKMQQQLREKLNNIPLPSLEEIGTIQLQELYKFENQLACEAVQKSLPQNSDIICGKGYITFRISEFSNGCTEINKDVFLEDGIQYYDDGSICTFQLTVHTPTPISNIDSIIAGFRKRIEEIQSSLLVESQSPEER